MINIHRVRRNAYVHMYSYSYIFNSCIHVYIIIHRLRRPDSDKCGVIYKIKCSECNHVYIGETGKELYKRVSEHKLAVRRGDNLSAINHQISGHSMNWDHTEVLAQQSTAEKRRILESMYSNNNNNALNRSSKVPNAYSSIVNQIVRHN